MTGEGIFFGSTPRHLSCRPVGEKLQAVCAAVTSIWAGGVCWFDVPTRKLSWGLHQLLSLCRFPASKQVLAFPADRVSKCTPVVCIHGGESSSSRAQSCKMTFPH